MLGRLEMCEKFESPLGSILALLQKPLLRPFFSVVDTSTDQQSDLLFFFASPTLG